MRGVGVLKLHQNESLGVNQAERGCFLKNLRGDEPNYSIFYLVSHLRCNVAILPVVNIATLPLVTEDLPISPRFTTYNFYRAASSALLHQPSMVGFYLPTSSRSPLQY